MTDIAPSFSKIQQESVQFNEPVSESANTSIGALANALRECILPVGSIVQTMLTEAAFQGQTTSPSPERWILADGRDVTGSEYNVLTGTTNVPDLRGVYLRGKDNGRGLDPHGDLALGSYYADTFLSHDHGFHDPSHSHSIFYNPGGSLPPGEQAFFKQNAYQSGTNMGGTDINGATNFLLNTVNSTGITFSAAGGIETNPKTVVINVMIRIN